MSASPLLTSVEGLGLVLAAATLLYLLRVRSQAPAEAARPAQVVSRVFRPSIMLALTALGVLLAGVVLYQQQSAEVSRRAQDNLAHLAELTARRIEAWLDGCRTDLEFAGRNPLLAHAILNRRTVDANIRKPDLKGGLDVLRLGEGFESLQVFAPGGESIEHAGGAIELTERLRFWIRGAELTGRVVMSDLYVPADSADGQPVVDFVVAIMRDDRPNTTAGVLVARVDPDAHLYPLLQVPNATLDSTVFAIGRRADAAMAALTGLDARGERTLATSRPISDTPWFLIATVSEAAILAPLQRAARVALLLAAAGLVVSGWLVVTWWRSERRHADDHLEERVAERTVELEQAKNAAEHSDRVKSAFLSSMSHELRTPLNAIVGFTDVLLQGLSGPLNEAQQRQLQIVRDSSAHLRALIEDVLDISRIEAGQVGLEFTAVDLHGLVHRRIEAFRPEYARKGIALRLEVEEALPVVRSDSKRTAQVVNHLLSNALKFTDSGSVTVRLRSLPDRLELLVVDTGIGISPDAQAQLFNPFTQVARPGGRMREGAGLGLAISRNLARALGGDITLASEVGCGSRFTFWLPLQVAEPAATDASPLLRLDDARRAIGAV
jgi:signal transduction histidine kinase